MAADNTYLIVKNPSINLIIHLSYVTISGFWCICEADKYYFEIVINTGHVKQFMIDNLEIYNDFVAWHRAGGKTDFEMTDIETPPDPAENDQETMVPLKWIIGLLEGLVDKIKVEKQN
jgi:hypothetical protein